MRARTTCLLLAVVLASATAGRASAADPVRSATREVAAVRAQVDRTAAELAAGSRRLERSQEALADVRRQADAADREAARAQARATAARDRLRRIVAAAYRSPVPDTFVLALSGPDAFRATVAAQGDLHRAGTTSGDLVREATDQRLRARAAARRVAALERDAATRARDLARQVGDLRRTAADTERRLRTATRRLSTARARASSASCSRSTTAVANGFLPRTALCPLAGAAAEALRADAAAAFDRLSAASLAERGTRLCVTDSYRSYARQVDVFARKPSLAAVPGTSRHGYGLALDLGCGVESFGTEAYRWMKANGPRFGWVHPSWAEPGGSMPEPWHWEHVG